MCVTEIFTDIYPNNACVQRERLLLCNFGHEDRPCGAHYRRQRPPRLLTFPEAPAAIMGTQAHPPPPPPPPPPLPLHLRPVEVIETECQPKKRQIKKRAYWPKDLEFIFEVRIPDDKKKKRDSREPERDIFIVEPPIADQVPRSPYPPPPPPPPPHAPMPPMTGFPPPPPPPPPPPFPPHRYPPPPQPLHGAGFQIPIRNRGPPPIVNDHRFGGIPPPPLSPLRQHHRPPPPPPPRNEGDAILAQQVEAERRRHRRQVERAEYQRERDQMARERQLARRREREEEQIRISAERERARRQEEQVRQRALDRERDRERERRRQSEATRDALLRGEATHRRIRPPVTIHQRYDRGSSSGDEGWRSAPGDGVRIVTNTAPRRRLRRSETLGERGDRIISQAIDDARWQEVQERRLSEERRRAEGGLRRRGTVSGGERAYDERRRRASFRE